MKSMETGRQDGGSDKNHAPFSVGKTGNISRKFLTIILKIFDKNFERLQCEEAGMTVVTPENEKFIELAKPAVEKWAAENGAEDILTLINNTQ